ncbi:MAG: c-type cytochrome [Paracoccaceae bacterium]
MLKSLNFALAFTLLSAPAIAGNLNLGRAATEAEIAAWDIDVRPDGLGLPEGSGTVTEGEEIFSERCAVCHGDFGEAVGRWPVLSGGHGSLGDDRPVKTIGSYWPYLSTVWDYIHRAMPFGDAQSLEDDQVYAIVAYLMYVNDIVDDEDFELSRGNFLDISLENAPNFMPDNRPETEYAIFTEACMDGCKDSVEITKHAAVVDVTPEETKANELRLAITSVVTAAQQTDAPEISEAAPEAQSTPIDTELAAAGEKVFKKCKACHQIGEGAKHRTGPILNDLFGRIAGTTEDFKFSSAMIEAGTDGLVWDAATLDEFLIKPKAMIARTKMSFAGLRKEADRAALIEYLRAGQ